MRTLEYRIYPTEHQRQTIGRWLNDLRWVWNQGVELLEELELFTLWGKHPEWEPPFPLPYKVWWLKESGKWLPIPYTPIHRSRRPPANIAGFYGQTCPCPYQQTTPRLANASAFALAAFFAHKRHPDKPWLQAIPANFIRGVTTALAVAWEQYKKKPERGAPRYKRFGASQSTLIYADPKTSKLQPEGRSFRIPKLGVLRSRGCEEWPTDVPICLVKITSRPSGYYLQLTGDLPDSWQPKDRRLKPRSEALSFDFESHHQTGLRRTFVPWVAQDVRRKVLAERTVQLAKATPGTPTHSWLSRKVQSLRDRLASIDKQPSTEQRLDRLGCKAARQRDGLKLEQRRLKILAEQGKRRDHHKEPVGSNLKATYADMAGLHERFAMRRRNTNHKLSTFKVRTFGNLAIAEIPLRQMVRRPKPQPSKRGLGKFDPNGAREKAQFNRRILGLGLGDFVSQIETKAKTSGNNIVRVANQSAAKIRADGLPFARIHPQWGGAEPLQSGPSLEVSEQSEGQEEGTQVPPGGMPASVIPCTSSEDQFSSTRQDLNPANLAEGRKASSKRTRSKQKSEWVLENPKSQSESASRAVDPPTTQIDSHTHSSKARRSVKKQRHGGSGSDSQVPP